MAYETTGDKKNFNTRVCPLFPNADGVLQCNVTDKNFEKIMTALEQLRTEGPGGRFKLTISTEEARAKWQDPETAPHAYFEYVSKDTMDKARAKYKGTK